MSRVIARAENWERAYEAFSQVNFNSFDYNAIKESMIDYLKLYFPEDFNNYIESDELIALVELFAYLGELLAYRIDLNSHENFISTAERKESVLRLAKLISYSPSRNIPARGLVKINSVQTTETLLDSNGVNLANRRINWNDPNNINWKDQFLLIMNRVLEQEFGTVAPSDRQQIDDVLFELYTLNNNPINQNGPSVFTYSVSVSGENYPMELVPTELTNEGPAEKRPEINQPFSILYASDGLGDASDTTGFLCFTKQGTLQRRQTTFDGVTPNQTYELDVNDVNNTDIWVNNVDPSSREILTEDPYADIVTLAAQTRYGEWVEVDISNAQNILFNTNQNRRKFEAETLDNDNVRLIFGDGEFANIPNGAFDIWFRTSQNADIAIPQSAAVNKTASFSYTDVNGNTQTLTFTYSLINSLLNNSASEDTEHIRRVAPSVYYSQDRMVNGRDYNTFLLQDPSILKLRAVNRTFAGDSKYISWHDPSGSYENVKIFGDDLAVYFVEDSQTTSVANITNAEVIVESFIEPYLSSTNVFLLLAPFMEDAGKDPANLRRQFDNRELTFSPGSFELSSIISAIENVITSNTTTQLYYSAVEDEWTVGSQYPDSKLVFEITLNNGVVDITVYNRKLIAHSDSTNFWHVNEADQIVNFDTFNTVNDQITVLKANLDSDGNILDENIPFNVVGRAVSSTSIPDTGLPDINTLSIVPNDVNDDGVPDNIDLSFGTGSPTTNFADLTSDYVYLFRESVNDTWQVVNNVTQTIIDNYNNEGDGNDGNYARYPGRYGLNFAWFHYTPQYHLVDPAPTNIIDIYVITKGYFTSLRRWLEGQTTTEPEPPSSLNLRNSYSELLNNKMISDSVVLHSGKIKLLFGSRAEPKYRGTFKVIRPTENTSMTNNQVKSSIVEVIRTFFDINYWEFGQTFHLTELISSIHNQLRSEIESVVLIPDYDQNQFGDLFEIQAREDEMFYADITTSNIEVVTTYTPNNLRQ